MRQPFPRILTALAVTGSVFAAGCGGVSSPSQNRTQTFTGTVPVGGFGPTHEFRADGNGEMSVRMTAISPTSSAILGTQVNQSVNGTCNVVLGQEPFTGLNRDVLQLPVNRGTYCVAMFDSVVGRLTQPQTYTIQVSYP